MISIGTDIVNIDRIKKLSNDTTFLNKIFTDKEIRYCKTYSKSFIHLSGKYAAKEAVKKAVLSAKLLDNISMKDIEVLNNEDKSPYVIIHNKKHVNCKISISHDGKYAIAYALIEK